MKIIKFVNDYYTQIKVPWIKEGEPLFRKGQVVKMNNDRAKHFTKTRIDWDEYFKTGKLVHKPCFGYILKDLGNYHGSSKHPCYITCKQPE